MTDHAKLYWVITILLIAVMVAIMLRDCHGLLN